MTWLASLLLTTLIAAPATPSDVERTAIVRAMRDEVSRSVSELRFPDADPPYSVAYTVYDLDNSSVTATRGAVLANDRQRVRYLRVDLRVGDPNFDNGNFAADLFGQPHETLPLDDDYDALRHDLWLATDRAYKQGFRTLERKRAEVEAMAATAEPRPDFSREKPARVVARTVPALSHDSSYAALAERISAVFREFPEIVADAVTISHGVEHTYFVSSEGSLGFGGDALVGVDIACRTQADDGMTLKNFTSLFRGSAGELPAEAALLAEARRVARELVEIRSAPVLSEYDGPVLFEGRAAAQVMRGFLVSQLSGTPAPRSRRAEIGRMWESAFTNKLGRRILPPGFVLEDDPTRAVHVGLPLIGGYTFDAEGMPAQRVVLAEDGVLKRLLMSRTPRKEGDHSNGHGRASLSGPIRGAVGNLIVTSNRGRTNGELREELLRQVQEDGQPYGLIIRLLDDVPITGPDEGSAPGALGGVLGSSGVTLPRPLVAVKVMPDGREELVRGLVFEPQRLRALLHILGAGKQVSVDNFFSAAGPMAAVASMMPRQAQAYTAFSASVAAPALLFENVELKKSTASFPKPPLLPQPGAR